MDRSDIVAKLRTERAELDRLGVASLHLFGSAARGDAHAGSDADFLVRFTSTPTFDLYMDLKLHLEQVLGAKVDLVTEGALRPLLRAAIERDAVRVA